MSIIDKAVEKPTTVIAGLILVLLAGITSFLRLPVQMTPSVDSVFITINTAWENATPSQIESEIIVLQEKALANVKGLLSLTTTSIHSLGTVSLEFRSGVNVNEAMQEVLQKLEEVPGYPPNATKPIAAPINPRQVETIAWVALASSDPDFDTTTLYNLMKLRLQSRMERIKGVSKVEIVGARNEELQVIVDASAMAKFGLSYIEIRQLLDLNNQNWSGGLLPEGKYNLRVQTSGRYSNVEDIENIIAKRTDTGVVQLKDFAEVHLNYKEPVNWVRVKGTRMPLFSFQLEHGANLLETISLIDEELAFLNKPGSILDKHTKLLGISNLELVKIYDTSIYVDNAVGLIQSNILIGGLLAAFTLLLFLNSVRVIGVISIAIPVSIIASIVLLVLMGRTINIVSLAGLAFAIGMVIDNAIVVIENIYRHLEKGSSLPIASKSGTKEVGGAIFASTITTIIVFIPVLLIEDSAGQLFKDIALAMITAVSTSYVVAVLLIPTMANQCLKLPTKDKNTNSLIDRLNRHLNTLPEKIAVLIEKCLHKKTQWIVFSLFTTVTLFGTWMLAPKLDYLPSGNFNAALGILVPPPGYNLDKMYEIGEKIEVGLESAWISSTPKFAFEQKTYDPDLDTGTMTIAGEEVDIPVIEQYFLVAWNGQMIQFSMPEDDSKTVDLVELLNQSVKSSEVPDVLNFAFQLPLFKTGGNVGSSININVLGSYMDELNDNASVILNALREKYGPASIVPDPTNFSSPILELNILPDDKKLALVGLDRQSFGLSVSANGDGIIIPRGFESGGDLKDIKIITEGALRENPIDSLINSPLTTQNGQIIDMASVATIQRVASEEMIRRVERSRAITLQVTPPKSVPIEEVLIEIKTLIADLREQGVISPMIEISYSGSAGKLNQIKKSLIGDGSIMGVISGSLFMAVLLVYLVMVVLFQSWSYPAVIMITVPMATFGGFVGLWILHHVTVLDRYQPVQNLDVLTILGFIILAGVIVNNAILIVHKTIALLKNQKYSQEQAIIEAVRSRIRPILMSMTTSIGGMLPLILMPGSGSELYRGIGVVVVGGLFIGTLFTLILLPVIMSLFGIMNMKTVNAQ